MRSFFSGLVLWILLTGPLAGFSQAFSPYSRYGLGYLHSDALSSTKGMAGITTGYSSPMFINYSNPASYSEISVTTFEVGANADALTVRTQDSSYNGVNGSVNHIALGVPILKGRCGLSFGLLPFSHLNYDFAVTDADTSKVYSGKGSLYHVYVGAAYQIKGFSFGFNVGYLFGGLDYTKGFAFTDSISAYNVHNISTLNVGGFKYNVGVQYKKRILKKGSQNGLKTDLFVTAGAQGSTSVKLGSTLSSLWQRSLSAGEVTAIIDTPLTVTNKKGNITLPYNFSVGATVGNENWWLVGFDFRYAGWSNFRYDLNTHPLGDSWRLAFGASITPNYDSKKFFPHIQYKAGGYYGKSEIIYNGQQLSEYGGTLGISVPIFFGALYREAAKFHFAADIGSRSPADKTLISENYYRFNFGFTLNNVWFQKRKFD